MYEIGIDGLTQLIAEGRMAAQYAWDRYDELAARTHTYTLYGPYDYSIGAAIPTNFIKKETRRLTKNTRRKNYFIYELDDKYNVLRTLSILDHTRVECIYHHFQINDTTYAYPFRGREKARFKDETNILKYVNGMPTCFALATKDFVFAQFLEYQSDNKMCVSTYRYSAISDFTLHGYPVDRDAPVGTLNSPVNRHCREETVEYIDFSRWLE